MITFRFRIMFLCRALSQSTVEPENTSKRLKTPQNASKRLKTPQNAVKCLKRPQFAAKRNKCAYGRLQFAAKHRKTTQNALNALEVVANSPQNAAKIKIT